MKDSLFHVGGEFMTNMKIGDNFVNRIALKTASMSSVFCRLVLHRLPASLGHLDSIVVRTL